MERHLVVVEENGYVFEKEYDVKIGGDLKARYISDTFYIEDGNQYIVRNVDIPTMFGILDYEELEMNIRNERTCEFMLEKFDMEFPREFTPLILKVGESYLWLDLSKGILSPKVVTRVI